MGNVSKYVLREQEKEISLWHYGVPKGSCKETGLFGVWHTNAMPKVCTYLQQRADQTTQADSHFKRFLNEFCIMGKP